MIHFGGSWSWMIKHTRKEKIMKREMMTMSELTEIADVLDEELHLLKANWENNEPPNTGALLSIGSIVRLLRGQDV